MGKRFRMILAVSLVTMVWRVAGCSDVPQPFRHDFLDVDNPLTRLPTVTRIVVLPLGGNT